MKKIVFMVAFVLLFATGCTPANENQKLGIARYAAHGKNAFAVTTVIMNGDVIGEAIIDEYQYMAGENIKCVPNAETAFSVFEGDDMKCLISKRENNEFYSKQMTDKGGATNTLLDGYQTIENFAKGKTIAELESAIQNKSSEEVVDAISGATLVDAKGYIESIIVAAKNAK